MLLARRKLLRDAVALCDAATVASSFATAYFIVDLFFGRDFVSYLPYLRVLAASVVIWPVCLRVFGLHSSATYTAQGRLLWRLLQSHFIAGLLLLSTMYLTKSVGISRLLIQSFLVLSVLALTIQKLVLRAYLDRVRRFNASKHYRIILVAYPTAAERYLRLIRSHASMLADVIGLITPKAASASAATVEAVPVLGAIDDLPMLMQTRVIDEVVVVSSLDEASLERLSRWCAIRGVVMRILVETPRPPLGVWTAEHFGEGAFLLSLAAIPQSPFYLLVKRAMDIAVAALGLLFCACAYLWYGWRLEHETKDSVLFRQERVGQNGRRFMLYKFRTMSAGAEQLKNVLSAYNEMRGPIFKLSNDPRVTPTGRKLRRRHLDELPQFWNVLKGEMSLVGTRPPTEDEVLVYNEHHHRRLSLKPGLTGLWQLNGNAAVKDFEEVVKLDCAYIDNWSLLLDFKIMVRTAAKVMRGDGW